MVIVVLSCDQFTLEQLATLYNQARSDYLVPMQMTEHSMASYITHYDVLLEASIVALDEPSGMPVGILMVGHRDERAWITRLGVHPEFRQHRASRTMLGYALEQARSDRLRSVQLEFISGNEPAHRLFKGIGFTVKRPLIVLERSLLKVQSSQPFRVERDVDWIIGNLQTRTDEPTWIEETTSLLNIGSLSAIVLDEQRWLIHHVGNILMHYVFVPDLPEQDYETLLQCLHHPYPNHAAKVENIVPAHPAWVSGAFSRLGYQVAFERIEMELVL